MEQYYGTGRRKEAVARVFLRPGNGKVTVNGQDFQDYFQGIVRAVAALEPLRVVDAL
ncbi:MAG: 30S ribosomal protein S9, partial [Thermus sp.]|uniref:30S ribosomal protein S9 n=1 Tax=Thermus sp. TaxID=275 RepID=UPI00351BDACA